MQRDPGLIPLSHQHQHGLALCVLTRRSLAADSSPENLERLAKRIVERYELELANHFELEEQVVFPAIRAETGEHPLLAQLEREHREMERLVVELRATPDVEVVQTFCTLIEAHIRREERELFEDVQDKLSRKTMEAIGMELNRRAVRICL